MTTPTFDELLDQIRDRSAAFHAAASAAPDRSVAVPGCPDWSLDDLVTHLGEVQRSWAHHVLAGPSSDGEPTEVPPSGYDEGDPLTWSAASTQVLLEALREAGPEAGSWTWWPSSDNPETAAAVARHQVQEAAVHAYDAQEAIGSPEPIPADIAVDAIDEFIAATMGTMPAWVPWPHGPAELGLVSTEGPSWTVQFSAEGVTAVAPPVGGTETSLTGSASDLLLVLYDRIPADRVTVEGDQKLVDDVLAWANTD